MSTSLSISIRPSFRDLAKWIWKFLLFESFWNCIVTASFLDSKGHLPDENGEKTRMQKRSTVDANISEKVGSNSPPFNNPKPHNPRTIINQIGKKQIHDQANKVTLFTKEPSSNAGASEGVSNWKQQMRPITKDCHNAKWERKQKFIANKEPGSKLKQARISRILCTFEIPRCELWTIFTTNRRTWSSFNSCSVPKLPWWKQERPLIHLLPSTSPVGVTDSRKVPATKIGV